MKLNRNPPLKSIVLVSGLTRSGKALLCPIISSFNNADKINVNFFLEQIPTLNYLKKLDNSTAEFLLRTGMNFGIYDDAIGRNSNFRPNDFTSVWKYKNPIEYIQRLFQPDGDKALADLDSQNKIFSMMIHNGLWHSNLWFKALPTAKMIHMQRNPIDIVYSWIGKGYGGDFYTSNRANIVTYQYKRNILPYYAYGWEDEYLSLGQVDRVVSLVAHIRRCHYEAYAKLSSDDQKRVLFVKHQTLITKTQECLQTIKNFIGEGPSKYTPTVLMQQNCPRDNGATTPFSTNNKTHQEKLEEIRKLSRPEAYSLLLDMQQQFESEQLTI